MPNTALTSPVDGPEHLKMFNITFRAGILNETVSEWATKKENTIFEKLAPEGLSVSIEAGKLDAIIYVLLHEATHVVDAVLEITPHPDYREALVKPTAYTAGIWYKMNIPEKRYIDTVLEKTRFRSGKAIPITGAPAVYEHLRQMPFPSLYGMASWFEDLAELESIYHMTAKLHQPYRVVVKKNDKEVASYEPMKNRPLKKRLEQLAVFYRS